MQSNNSMLAQDMKLMIANGIVMKPSLTINGFIYRGQFDFGDIVSAICAGFTHRPVDCKNNFTVSQNAMKDNMGKIVQLAIIT